MKLKINTQNKSVIVVTLINQDGQVDSLEEQNQWGSQVLLSLVDKILKKNKLNYKDLKEIEVEKGPGSFTGLRVGVSVANALAFSLKIPVNKKNLETKVEY